MKLPQIKTDKDAEIWAKELGKIKKEDLIRMVTRVLAAHPEAGKWVQDEMSASSTSHQQIYVEAEEKRKVMAVVKDLRREWEVIKSWTDEADRHYGLDYDEEDEAYSDGWHFQRHLAEHPEIPWEEKLKFLDEMIEVSDYDTDYFDWGDILYSAADSMISTREDYDKFTDLVENGELEGDFIQIISEVLERKFMED